VLPPVILQQMRRETFTPGWLDTVKELDALITDKTLSDPIQNDLAAFWRARQATIRTLVARAETLSRRLQAVGLPCVLCHADIHTYKCDGGHGRLPVDRGLG
jgi:spectinomycin phosphotransferase